jgi:hypothetical protein
MSDCPNLANCGFFKKYNATKQLACKGFVAQYCQGPRQEDCKRKTYRKLHGAAPSDDMLPTGQTISL